MSEEGRSDRWWDWYNGLTPRQKMARWWSIHWAPLMAFAALLAVMALLGWWLG